MKKMVLILFLGLCIVVFDGCKKTIYEKKKEYVINAMTNGRWYLENFTENAVNNTSDFIGYEFQFYEDGRLDAIRNAVIITGSWAADVNNLTLTVNFPTPADPLKKLNQPWKFIDSHVGLVFAETTTATGKTTIRLRKK